MSRSSTLRAALWSDTGILLLSVLLRVLLQFPTNGQYGFDQDEWVSLNIARRGLARILAAVSIFRLTIIEQTRAAVPKLEI